MDLYYNPLDRACKSIVGAIPRKTVVNIKRLQKERYPGGEDYFSAEVCNLVLRRDGKRLSILPDDPHGFRVDDLAPKFQREQALLLPLFRGRRTAISDADAMHKSIPCRDCNPVSWQLTVSRRAIHDPRVVQGRRSCTRSFPDRFYRAGEEPIKHGVMRKWGEQPYFRPNGEGKGPQQRLLSAET